jgi:hypothetical protein
MAIVLGSCGCGCGGGCEKVKTGCNFVLRKYDNNTRPNVSWTSEATEEEIACWSEPFGCPTNPFSVSFSACTGEGEIYRAGGGGGGGGGGGDGSFICTLSIDDGTIVYTDPCVTVPDQMVAGVMFYSMYNFGMNYGEPYNGEILWNGVTYIISGGKLMDSPDPDPEASPALMNAPAASQDIAPMSSGILLGTYNQPYTDEYIDFDQIGEVDLTENESQQDLCKFSYNFSFTPEDGVDYYVMTMPCNDTQGYYTVNLAPDGRAYFNSRYNETTKMCTITQASTVA